ncbi:MAG: tributyrin esterase [Chloroflexi bacterium B3_Chlor]|nr:MAG: tributyrin esterase [Chloroflexi bacterium B3_Chlor]
MAHAPNVLDAKSRDLRGASTQVKAMLATDSVVVKNAAHLHGLCGGLKAGEITIDGDSGDYLAVLNDGAVVKVTGNAGKYVADNMTGGKVLVEGDADYGAAQYCYGGTVVIRGTAGDFTATMNKGATIIIGGDVGNDAATYMMAGDVIIVGNGGENLGNYLIRGNIYIRGDWASLGHNCAAGDVNAEDAQKLEALLKEYGIAADARSFRKVTPLSDKPFYSH